MFIMPCGYGGYLFWGFGLALLWDRHVDNRVDNLVYNFSNNLTNMPVGVGVEFCTHYPQLSLCITF